MKKDSFEKKLAAYVAMSAAYLAGHPFVADAQVIYTDVNPDLVIDNSFFNLDLNNDGIYDVKLLNQHHSDGGPTCPYGCEFDWSGYDKAIIEVQGQNLVAILNYSFNYGYPLPINSGNVIGAGNVFGNGFGGYGAFLKMNSFGGSFPCSSSANSFSIGEGYFGSTDSFLGVRLNSGGTNYYGWARLSVDAQGRITLKDYAVNTIPDSSIVAGDIGGSGCALNNLAASPSGNYWLCNDSIDVHLFNAGIMNIQWMKNGNWLVSETDSSFTAHTGNYQVLVSDSSCAVIVNAINVLKVNISSIGVLCSHDDMCSNSIGDIDISVNGVSPSFTYQWSSGQTSEDINNIPAGIYQLTVTTSVCSVQDSVTINIGDSPPPTLTETYTDSVCANNGSIDLTITGIAPPYNIGWSNFSTNEDQYNLSAGTYTVTVLDDNGCTAASSITIFNYNRPTPIISELNNTLYSSYSQKNQWYYNLTTNPLVGDTLNYYFPNTFGTFFVEAIYPDSCTVMSAPYIFWFDGINNISFDEFSFSVSDKKLLIHLADNSLLGNQIEIINELGQIVSNVTVTNQNPEADLSALPGGIYFFHIRSKQKTYSGKFFID